MKGKCEGGLSTKVFQNCENKANLLTSVCDLAAPRGENTVLQKLYLLIQLATLWQPRWAKKRSVKC